MTLWRRARAGLVGPTGRPTTTGRLTLAVVAGLLLALAFPKAGVAGLAWVAPGLMLASAWGTRGWETFRIGYAAGLVFYLVSLYWLLLIPYRWMGLPLGPALGWLSLSAYLALYPAAWVWLVLFIADRRPEMGGPKGKGLAERWLGRALLCVFAAAAWVALEMVLARLFSGFPWDLLGVSQYRMTPLIQMASVSGVYGLSFLVVWFSAALFSAGLAAIRQPDARSAWSMELGLPLLAVGLVYGMGSLQMLHKPSRGLSVTLIQPSIPQTLIWDQSRDDERFSGLLRLAEKALESETGATEGRTRLMIWPEAAVPKLLRYDERTFDAVTALAKKHRVWMIIGADDAEPRDPPTGGRKADYFNSSFLIDPEGRLMDRYKKRSLVIFGEYVPLERWLPFLKFFTPVEGGFTPGDRAVQFEMPDLEAKASVLICFEDIFPGLAREATKPDTDFLVNLTNNGWFGESAAQWQHAATAVFRAVENRIPLVRGANNGLTCLVDSDGSIRNIFRDREGTIYGAGWLTVEVPLLNGGKRFPTFYNRHGDVFGWTCVAVTGAVLAVRWLAGRRRPAQAAAVP